MERTYDLYLMDCIAAPGGGAYTTSRRARTLTARTIRDAAEACRQDIEVNDRRLEEHWPDVWQSVENGVASSWRLVSDTGREQVSTFPDEEGSCGSQWS